MNELKKLKLRHKQNLKKIKVIHNQLDLMKVNEVIRR